MGKYLSSFFIIACLATATIIVIALGRGYRFNFDKRAISPTGLLVATSDPTGAQIILDGSLKSATNTTLALPPGWYQVRLVKEGFIPWEKKLRIQGEVVSETQAILFPSSPTLIPITKTGITIPILSPDGTKIAYAVSQADNPSGLAENKAGLWVLNLNSQLLSFSHDPQLIAKSSEILDFSTGNFLWSLDSKQVLATVGTNHYLIKAEKDSQMVFLPEDAWIALKKTWGKETQLETEEKLALLPPEFVKIATESGKVIAFSPNETKILYQATASASLPQIRIPPPIATNPTPEVRNLTKKFVYVYDVKEDKNFEIKLDSPFTQGSLSWFPSSRHLILVESGKISILEYDNTNKATVYDGPFEKFVAPVPSGSKLLILTSYNRPLGSTGKPINITSLYSINLR